MKRSSFIGIDISKLTLDVCVYRPEHKEKKVFLKVLNTPKGHELFLKELRKLNVLIDEAFVCMEYCGVYGLELGFYLETKIDYCFCNPLHIKRSLGLTRGKSDKLDSYRIARFSYLFRDELKPMKMPSDCLIQLKSLISERSRIVKSIVIEKQTLSDLTATMSKPAKDRAENRLTGLNIDKDAIEKEILEQVKSVDKINKNYELLISITGISLINAVVMILCTNNFESITNPRSFACYCGVAPFEHSSGTSIKGKTRVNQYANKVVKTYLSNAARAAMMHDPELKAYYNRKRAEGKDHGTVMNALKFKLITRAFAVIKRGTPYVKLKQVA
tara:strand:+ start:170 stop:1159 length:990 start_codon:yes stop_codon:yes gene_type:complete